MARAVPAGGGQMRRRTVLSLVATAAFAVADGWRNRLAAGDAPFRFAIVPHSSARLIFAQYQPIRLALERGLGGPVELQTAPDFLEFVRRAIHQDYDLVMTSGPQARLLQTDAGYQPLVTYVADFKAVIIVAATSPIRTAKDLAYTTVVGLNKTSLGTTWAQHWLADNHVQGTQFRFVTSNESMANLLLADESTAGFMSLANFQALAPALQAKLRFLDQSPPLLGRVYLVNRRQIPRAELILGILLAFAASAEGRAYFDLFPLGGYRPILPGEMTVMNDYAEEVRRAMTSPSPP